MYLYSLSATPTATPTSLSEDGELGNNEEANEIKMDSSEEDNMWEESFKTHHDSKPHGKLLAFLGIVLIQCIINTLFYNLYIRY